MNYSSTDYFLCIPPSTEEILYYELKHEDRELTCKYTVAESEMYIALTTGGKSIPMNF
jgi:hypothetical protein